VQAQRPAQPRAPLAHRQGLPRRGVHPAREVRVVGVRHLRALQSQPALQSALQALKQQIQGTTDARHKHSSAQLSCLSRQQVLTADVRGSHRRVVIGARGRRGALRQRQRGPRHCSGPCCSETRVRAHLFLTSVAPVVHSWPDVRAGSPGALVGAGGGAAASLLGCAGSASADVSGGLGLALRPIPRAGRLVQAGQPSTC